MDVPDCDYIGSCVEEIALEGLDGITLSALWVRLKDRPNFCMTLDAAAKQYLWEVCILQPDLETYVLPEPRPPLVIFNRFANVDPETGLIVEPQEFPLDIYPFNVIQDPTVFGSCATYHTRIPAMSSIRSTDDYGVVTPLMTLSEAEDAWGERLVLVASQERRRRTLLGRETDPRLQLTPIQYAMLERIGRARYLGEVTQGKNSLSGLHSSAKTLFYHRKLLLQKGVITKQLHYQKSFNGQLRNGMLLHLARFYVERKSKIFLMLQEIGRYLQSKPNQTDSIDSIKKYMGIRHRIVKQTLRKSLSKMAEIRMMAIRELNPDTPPAQCYFGNGKERTVRVLQLRDNIDLDNLEKILYEEEEEDGGLGVKKPGSKTGKGEEDGDDEEDDDEEMDAAPIGDEAKGDAKKQLRSPTLKYGIPDPRNQVIDRPMLHQAYKLFEQLGPNGASQRKFAMLLGVPRLEGRAICRNLQRLGVVSVVMKDAGRQRITHYTAKRFTGASAQHRELYEECQKMLQITMGSGEPKQHMPAEECPPNVVSASVDPAATVAVEQCTTELGDASGVKQGPGTLMDDVQKMFKTDEGGLAVTSKILKRVNLILQAVRQAKVIENHFNLQKLIVREEAKEGGDHKVDRKSIFRLVKRLAKEGYVKYIQTILRHGDKEKKIHMICDPSLQMDDPLIQSAVEQAKFKYFAISNESGKTAGREQAKDGTQRTKGDGHVDNQVWKSVLELRNLYEKDHIQTPLQYNQYVGRMHGYEPKFIRIKTFHEYLYYLVHGYEGQPDLPTPEEVKRLDAAARIPFPKVYHPQTSWKMFVAPLQVHAGWRTGWCLFSDVLLRMPLSILVKLVNYNFKIEGIEEFLDHPIKRHFPISQLPKHLRNYLLFARKYIFSTHEVAVKMAYMGLLSFSQKELKDKDQVFMYVHLAARVVDTTTSRRGYHTTSDEDYKVRLYRFVTADDLSNYWVDLETVCLNTPLGCYNQEQGKEVTFEMPSKKPALVKAAASKADCDIQDEGVIPGDGRGAGGLDSMLYAHLKRNWTWLSTPSSFPAKRTTEVPQPKANKGKVGTDSTELAQPSRIPSSQFPSAFVKFLRDRGSQVPKQPSTRKRLTRLAINTRLQALNSEMVQGQSVPTPRKKTVSRTPKTGKGPDAARSVRRRGQGGVRVWTLNRKKPRGRKPYYDETDRAALKLIAKQRVSWTSKEDSLLLLCMVASKLLGPRSKCLVVPFTVVRDFLHGILESMRNKTSRACQRRLHYMMRNPYTIFNVSVFVGESRQDKEIAELLELPHVPKTAEDEWKSRFEAMMEKLLVKFRVSSTPAGEAAGLDLPGTLEEFADQFNVTLAKELLEQTGSCTDVKNVVDIHFAVVYTLILSSVAVVNEVTNWSYYLYKIYKQYPESLLHSALGKLQSSMMLCRRKDTSAKAKKRMLLVTMPYQMSTRYEYLFVSRFRSHVFSEAYELLNMLLRDADEAGPGVPIVADQEGGYAAAIVSLVANKKLMFDLTVPDEVIILNLEVANLSHHLRSFHEKRTHAQLRALDGSGSGPSSKRVGLLGVGSRKDWVTNAAKPLGSLRDGAARSGDNEEQVSTACVPPSKKRKLSAEVRTDSEAGGGCSREMAAPSTLEERPEDRSGEPLEVVSTLGGKDDGPQELLQVESETSKIQFQPLTRSSRFALYMLRQQLTESPIENQQHSQDYLAIKPCSITCRLSPAAMTKATRSDYPLPAGTIQRMIGSLTTRLPSTSITLSEAINHYRRLGCRNEAVEEMCSIYGRVLEGRELGLKLSDLEAWFSRCSNSDLPLRSHLDMMAECHLVLRVGVVSIRYVAQAHAKPWLIDAEKVKEQHSKAQEEEVHSVLGRYLCKPWNKPDGSVNTGSLKHMLQGIMSYLMSYPGVTYETLCQKYAAVLNPFQVLEFLNILEEMECIRRTVIWLPSKPTLFSAPAAATAVENGDSNADDAVVCYEPELEGVFKLMHLLDDESLR